MPDRFRENAKRFSVPYKGHNFSDKAHKFSNKAHNFPCKGERCHPNTYTQI